MPLTTSVQMLRLAQRNGYAIGAFNAENLEMIQAIISAAQQLRAPVIVQTTPGTVAYAGTALFVAAVTACARAATVPVCLHLDHGDSVALCARALEDGYTSVMMDGSHETLEGNIALVNTVVAAAQTYGMPVEAELGRVGGKEDGAGGDTGEDPYTIPAQAEEFVRRTGVNSLAVAIGTAHGVYKTVPKLDIGRLTQIRKVVDVPLVLHGASGLSDEAVRDCVREGICKVNYATELRIAYTQGIQAWLSDHPDTIDPKKYGAQGREWVKQRVMERIRVCGSEGRAEDR